jgi:AraC-like DNA-binding protein
MTAISHSAFPLLQALQRVLPALETDVAARTVIARSSRKLLQLPHRFQAVPYKARGRRVAIRNHSLFDRAALLTGNWPDDGMRELRVPKLALVASGKAGLRVANYVLQCPQGTAVFLPPGTPHADGSTPHLETLSPEWKSCALIWITPMVSGLGCRMCHSEGEKHLPSEKGEKIFLPNPRLLQLFSTLSEEATRPAEAATTMDAGIFESLFLGFVRALLRDVAQERFLAQEFPQDGEGSLRRDDDPIASATLYISTYYASTLSLDEVARRFLMSRAQFTRKFREQTGQSFLEFLNSRRIEQAKKLLSETEWTASLIARYVGFQSPTYFNRLFLREVQVSPIEFRRQSREIHGGKS